VITSVLCQAIDAVVVLATAAVAPVTVYDGPQFTGDIPQSFVVIGAQGDIDAGTDWSSASGAQDWSQLGALTRDETTQILCVSVAWDVESMSGARNSAMAAVTAIETAMRTPPNIRLGLAAVLWADIDVTTLTQASSNDGYLARIGFSIKYTARLSGV
jgi:hypothetical protein